MPPIPANRIVAFIGSRLVYVEAAVAAWLVAKVNILSIPGFDQQNVATWIAAAVTALLTAAVTHLAHMKWLSGWIAYESGSQLADTQAINSQEDEAAGPEYAPQAETPGGDYDPSQKE